MSPLCPILRASIDEYLGDALPAPQRRILREHLAGCAECGALAVKKDATMVFARPLREPVGAPEAAQILSAVRTGVALIETERRIGRRSRLPVAGGAAAAAVVAALILLLPAASERRPESAAAARAASPAANAFAPAGLSSRVAAAPRATEASAATMYDLNPGAGREEPRVVWIVDGGLDI